MNDRSPQGHAPWHPQLGAVVVGSRVRFRAWAPTRRRVEVVLDPRGPEPRRIPLEAAGDGTFSTEVAGVLPGDLYAYALDGEGPFPDPCSRFQPSGVHGPSAVVDPWLFNWSDAGWRGRSLDRAVLYELHVGTFTPEGTFAGAMARLPYLADLGVTVVELMPVADFPGARNWGYDGASLFAPAHTYGTPDDLRRFVDAAHRRGIAVLLDVVYNHFGPDGAYAFAFSPFYRSERHESPWGAAVNVDGAHAGHVRGFFIENALHWLFEYHIDGFRFDATHAIVDDSRTHLLAELAARIRSAVTERTILLVAEDDRNLAAIVRPPGEGGWGLDAVWADDFHHQVHRGATGERDGYYRDYSGALADLATTMRHGWFFTGQPSTHAGRPRGTDPAGVPLERMVICLQNHDQVGNRPFGDRLHHLIDAARYRALTALLLFAPETPLLFMGQEWAADTPFQYFTDHRQDLGRLVTEGRHAEFSRFDAFADPALRARMPDPQAASTFDASRLDWNEQARLRHAVVLELYRRLLRMRHREPAFEPGGSLDVQTVDVHALAITRRGHRGPSLQLVVCLDGEGGQAHVAYPGAAVPVPRVLLTTEDPAYVESGDASARCTVNVADDRAAVVLFARPAAVILEWE